MKTGLVAVVALAALLVIAGCGETPMGASPVTDPGQGPGGDTGGLFGDQPGASDEGIPIEGDSSDPAGEKEPPPPGTKTIKPVEIIKAGGDLGTCVIGEACERKISAKGGSGEYVWTLVEGALPKGLEFADQTTKKIKIKNIEGQEIDEVGEFTPRLRVVDAADPTRSAERTFTLTINENIAMVLYTIGQKDDGFQVGTAVEEKDADGNAVPIIVPPNSLFLVEVVGHASIYKWSINGQEIVCNDQICEGTKDGLRLYKDTNLEPPNPPAHYDYMILQALDDFIGKVQKVEITATQDYGPPVSKTISSITFAQDPCELPLMINGQASQNITFDKEVSYDDEWSFDMVVSGETGNVIWTEETADAQAQDGLTFTTAANGKSGTFSGVIRPREGMPLEEYKEGLDLTLTYIVTDSCPARSPSSVELNITLVPKEEILKFDSTRLIEELVIGADDTDDETKMKASLLSKSLPVAEWSEWMGLDPYGDGNDCWPWQDCRDIDMQNVADTPSMIFGDEDSANVEKISSVQFTTTDPGSGGTLDVKVHAYEVKVPYWMGVAQGVGTEKDGAGSFVYAIKWFYSCTSGSDGDDDPCAPVRTREIGQAEGDGWNPHLVGIASGSPEETENVLDELGMPYAEETAAVLSGGSSELEETIEGVTGSDTTATGVAAVASGGVSLVKELF